MHKIPMTTLFKGFHTFISLSHSLIHSLLSFSLIFKFTISSTTAAQRPSRTESTTSFCTKIRTSWYDGRPWRLRCPFRSDRLSVGAS